MEEMLVPDRGRGFGKEADRIMRWNADVERRRREHHEKRCAEDPVYKRAYERQLEMMRRIQKMTGVAFAQLQDAMHEAEDSKCRQATNQTSVTEAMQKVKSHVEVMQERMALMDRMEQSRTTSSVPVGADMLSAGVLSILFADPEASRRLKEWEEEIPYAEEIRKADKEFDSELIRMSGFEW